MTKKKKVTKPVKEEVVFKQDPVGTPVEEKIEKKIEVVEAKKAVKKVKKTGVQQGCRVIGFLG